MPLLDNMATKESEKVMNLKRTSLEMAKIDKSGIVSFLKEIETAGIEIHDLMILRGSYVCCEAEWRPYKKEYLHMLYSLSKAFTALGTGFAVQEGLFNTEDTVYSFFEDEMKKEGFADSICEKSRKITIEHLLTMNTGQEEEPPILNYEFDGNWIAKFLQIDPVHEPGTNFFYDTTATYVLSAIITKVTGETLENYLKPRLFTPLGIDTFVWDKSPAGCSLGGIGLNLSIESIAKLGVFLLQEGEWEGKQLLNTSWIKRMTSNLVSSVGGQVYDNGDNWGCGYGYQIWQCIPDGIYRGDGAYGQLAIVAPKENLIIAVLAGTEDTGTLMNSMWKNILPACETVKLEDIKEAESQKMIFALPCVKGNRNFPKEFQDSYNINDNQEGIEKITFEISDEKLLSVTCSFKNNNVRCLKFGFEKWQDNLIDGAYYDEYYSCGDIRTSQISGSWGWSDNSLNLKLCYLNGPLGITAKCTFKDNEVEIKVQKEKSMLLKMEYEFRGEKE